MSNDIYAIRKANLRKLMEDAGGPNNLAKRLTLSNPSFLSHLAGPKPTRVISEKTARKIEGSLGLVEGWLDSPIGTVITYAQIQPKLKLVIDPVQDLEQALSVNKTNPAEVVYPKVLNNNENTIDQSRLTLCIEKVLSKGENLTANQLSKIITVLYSSSQIGEQLDATAESLIDLVRA